MFYRIYKVTNLFDNKSYIGLTTTSIERRWNSHIHSKSGCRYLSRAIQKHGKTNFKIEEIFNAFDMKSLKDAESYFIQHYKTLSPDGYNLTTGGELSFPSQESIELMKAAHKKIWEEPERHRHYSQIWRDKWKNKENNPQLLNLEKHREKYIEEKKTPVIGININDASILRFPTINEAEFRGYFITGGLSGVDKYNHNHTWFYDKGLADAEYVSLAEQRLGGFNNYSKGRSSWEKSDYNQRIQAMKDGTAHRSFKIICIHRRTLEIKEYNSLNEAVRDGHYWKALRDCLAGTGKHSIDYCCFYKTHNNIEQYIEQAKSRLGVMYKPEDATPILRTNIETNEEVIYGDLLEAVTDGFNKKSVRNTLRGLNKSHKGYLWTFIPKKAA